MATLASYWWQRGFVAISRSFRFHRPRGAFCHRGWCQQCKVRLDDGRVVLACRTTARGDELPPGIRDPLRTLGAVAERTPPWFYERHRFRGALQQGFVKSVRWMSAAPRLATARSVDRREATQLRTCDVLVVGGGLAGMSAARHLHDAGLDWLLVQAGRIGGSAANLRGQPLEDSLQHFPRDRCLSDHLCAGLYEDPQEALCIGVEGNVKIQYRRLVVATGAYDRLPTVGGNDLPGIIGLRAFERITSAGAVPMTTRIGYYGWLAEWKRAAAAARSAGLSIAFAAGPEAIEADVDAATKTIGHVALSRIDGKRRVRAVALSDGTRWTCDLLVVGFTQPSYEIQAQNGCAVELAGDPPIVRASAGGSAPMLVIGEAAAWIDPETVVTQTREALGRWLKGEANCEPIVHRPTVGQNLADNAFVCLCEDVRVRDIRAAIADGYRDVELVKRHTGAATGPCQGKLCHGALLACAAEQGLDVRIPTPRPLARPVPIRQLAGAGDLLTR